MAATWTEAGPTAPERLVAPAPAPQSLGYRVKVRLLGPPLTRDALRHERLTKRLALGVLSSDCISSSAYGTEEMLVILLPAFGMAAFGILLPLTLVILAVLVVVTLSYRDVVQVYTKAGGSYVVARENFGTSVAQVGAVALMLDYIVTVAVQSAAGSLAVTSALPVLAPFTLWISVGVVLVLCFGNLRGIREAGRAFAFPTYFFVLMIGLVIGTGVVREVLGDLPHYAVGVAGQFPVGHGDNVLSWLGIFLLLQAFANGGSSLTGLEAISNGVSAFKPPEGRNARKTLVVMSTILGTLVLGISWLAHETHAAPYESGTPTVISQVAKAVFGDGVAGHALFLLVQVATMLILWTGANTPFNGFPFLASFVAEDGFLPRQLTRRGHRLAFSNGIVVLCVVSILLLVGTGAHVDKLVAFYAIGVFTGFTLAGFGMAKYFRGRRTPGWRAKVAVNTVSGSVSAVVVLVFAVVKFTEGAWLVLLLFPIGVLALIRLNRQYRRETEALSSTTTLRGSAASRHVTVVLVDNADLCTLGAVRYALSKRSSDVRAVHFVIDEAYAERLRAAWCVHPVLSDVPLYLVDCPDRRLGRAAVELAATETADPGTDVTLLLPRRTYSPVLGRLLHDRTADEIARATSRLPRVVATIIPFDVDGLVAKAARRKNAARGSLVAAPRARLDPPERAPHGGGGAMPISDVEWRRRSTVEGTVRSVRVAPLSGAPTLQVELWDETGGITLVFYGRRQVPGLEAGRRVRAQGMVGDLHGRLAISNPTYELVRG